MQIKYQRPGNGKRLVVATEQTPSRDPASSTALIDGNCIRRVFRGFSRRT